jgi:phosphatidylinositol transfer protein SFH5
VQLPRYNIYGGGQDLKAVFSDVKRFLRWRVALMEKSIALLDFENVDQTVQVHGTTNFVGSGMKLLSVSFFF